MLMMGLIMVCMLRVQASSWMYINNYMPPSLPLTFCQLGLSLPQLNTI
jgi:hypothetical protein